MEAKMVPVRQIGTHVVLVSFLLGLLPPAAPKTAQARVDPLNAIKRQIHKPNMLVVIDTSGSMTGVPGGSFSYSSEVGVDCDDGEDCRGNGWNGTCSSSNRPCGSDSDCQHAYCVSGGANCSTDPDCITSGVCGVSGEVCTGDADCPPQTAGRCSASGEACSLSVPCPTFGRCAQGGRSCTNPGGLCTVGSCAADSSLSCSQNADCPRAASGGTCSGGGTPGGGCDDDLDCPSRKTCVTGETCRQTSDCPTVTRGYCEQRPSTSCQRNRDCSGRGPCLFPPASCDGQDNTCNLPYTTCSAIPNNTCNGLANTCEIPPNNCALGPANRCVQPPAGDICNLNAGTVSRGMCRNSQRSCSSNADCSAGDTCGPPTSRAVIAKRTLSKIINENSNIINLGMMTFYQTGYFPYYAVNSPTSTTERRFFGPGRSEDRGCFDAAHGPSATCNFQGTIWNLASTPNSRYEVNHGRGRKTLHDQDFCGKFCTVPGVGMGMWKGSYYTRTVNNGAVTSTKRTEATYQGKNITVGSTSYRYFDPKPDYYNTNTRPPITVASCGSVCSATCGGRWDTQLAPFMNPTASETVARQNTLQMLDWMEPAKNGGLVFYGGTPTGCVLENDASRTTATSSYHYMEEAKRIDTLSCRANFVLLLTDGEANGPGDTGCDQAACSAADPQAAGCRCRSVLAAWHMRQNLGVRTFVVGFSTDVSQGTPRLVNDNIAKAGGTDKSNDSASPYAYVATNETELVDAIQSAIYEAVKGTYSTSPATSSAGSQTAGGVTSGKFALESRVDFPSWSGHLLAYDVTSDPPVLSWDAATRLRATNWWERRIYVGTMTGGVIKIVVDPATKVITNKDALLSAGMGSTADEAEKVAKFIMGDPELRNPSLLGSIVNSTPIDVGMPGNNPSLPGGTAFYQRYINRPNLTYVGADDGMLHAFFTDSTVAGGVTYSAGTEAFAYIPPDMVPVVNKLYTQGGQIADPAQHIFGLANSPKVKSLCISGCDNATTAVWKTVLVMPEGPGGNDMFMLDITSPVSSTGIADPPVQPIWHTESAALKASYDANMGTTMSVPAFFFNKTDALDDNRLVFGSGYQVTGGASTQGRQLAIASASDGRLLETLALAPVGGCTQEYAVLSDVATARNYGRDEKQKLTAGYLGDTWGSLWRYEPGAVTRVANLGCQNPIHFAPTTVQLDRDDSANRAGDIYLVQVTNSALDDATTAFGASKIVIIKEKRDSAGNLAVDANFGEDGLLTLTVGVNAEVCGEIGDTGTCEQAMPTTARPTSTPLAILRRDGAGFQFMSLWYAPDAEGCGKGRTYFAMHELLNDRVVQHQGMEIAQEPVTSAVIVGSHVYILGSDGARRMDSNFLPVFVQGLSSPTPYNGEGAFRQLSWTERLD